MAEGITYYVRAILEAAGSSKAQRSISKWASGVAAAGDKMAGVGDRISGTFAATAMGFAKAATAAAALGGAYGIGKVVAGGVELNRQMENAQYKIAATMQLFNRNAIMLEKGVERALDPSEQFQTNLAEAAIVQEDLFRIAAKSPATYGQTQAMFDNILPGAISLTDNMEEIKTLTKQSLAIGQILGGEYAMAGSQLARILTGGAGAEMETWRQLLQKPIMMAGVERGWLKAGVMGEKLTMAFNKLSGAQRLTLVQDSLKKLGVVTEELGNTWDGVTSTVESNMQLIQKKLGQAIFTKIKDRIKQELKGGVFDPEGETQAKLENMASVIGAKLGMVADRLIGRIINGFDYVANHWKEIGEKLERVFNKAKSVAELFLKVAAARAIAGEGIALMGGGMSAVGGGVSKVAEMVASLGAASLWALPLIAAIAAGVAGVAVAIAGVGAFFVQHWDRIVEGFHDGTITLEPLLIVLETFWAKMVAVGEAFLGTTDPAKATQDGINMISEALLYVMGTIRLFLGIAGVLHVVFRGLIGVFAGLYGAIIGIVTGIVKLVEGLLAVASYIPGVDTDLADASGVSAIADGLVGHLKDINKYTEESFSTESKFFDAVAMWDATAARAKRDADKREGDPDEITWVDPTQTPNAKSGAGTQVVSPSHVTNIAKVIVNQDLRNHDPDRVIGAFNKGLERAVQKRTQALSSLESGI